MRVLFTTSAAPDKSPFFTSEKRPPLGIGSLISTVRNAGHEIFFIDNYLKPEAFIEEGFLQKEDIDLIGIHANTICFQDTLRMLKEIQQLREGKQWKGKVVIGGPHTSVAPDTIPDYVDYIVQGEGEEALIEIIEDRATSRILSKRRLNNIDTLAFQPWDIFTKMSYDMTCPWINGAPVFTMNTSRGCPYSCSFCSVGSIWGKGYTFLSAERIISEIEFLIKEYGAKGIYFREDNFTLNCDRVSEFCELLLKKNINISWACETRVDNLSEELIKLMARAGCKGFYLGIESGSQRILDFLKKGISIKQIKEVIAWSKSVEIKTYCSLITGIPGETYSDFKSTKKLIKQIQPFSASFNIFVGIPNSKLYGYVKENRLFEYEDQLGLLYPFGFDIKTKYHYQKKHTELVDYRFRKRTCFDRFLQIELMFRFFKKSIKKILRLLFKSENE